MINKKRLMSDAFSRNLIAPVVPLNSMTSPILAQSKNPQAYAEKNKEYNVTNAGVILERASAGFANEQTSKEYSEKLGEINRHSITGTQYRNVVRQLQKEKKDNIKKRQEWTPYQGEKHQPGVLGFNRI